MFSCSRVILLFIFSINLVFYSCDSESPAQLGSQLESNRIHFIAKMIISEAPGDVYLIEGKLERNGYDTIIKDFIIEADSAFADFGKIYAGVWHLTVTAYSSENIALYSGETDVNIISERDNIVYLHLEPTKGNLVVVLNWDVKADSVITIQPGPENGQDAEVWNLPCSTYYAYNRNLCENVNEGEKPYIRIASWTYWGVQATHRSYIKFNIESIDTRYYLYKANLYLYSETSGGQTQTGDNEFYIHRVISDWDENQIIWSTQPDTIAEKPLQDYIIVPKSINESQNYVIEITEMVKYWLAHPENNYGMRFCLTTEQEYRRAFWASSNYENPYKRPKLELKLKLNEQ